MLETPSWRAENNIYVIDEEVNRLRKISLWTIFYKSLYSPKEIAKYRFLTIGKTIQYVFILALLLSLSGFYDALFHSHGMDGSLGEAPADSGSRGVWTFLILVMTYIFISGLLFLFISILAAIGEPVARRLERKLPYRQSWRLTASSITLPVALFTLLDLLNIEHPVFFFLAIVIAIGMILASVISIPKPKKRS